MSGTKRQPVWQLIKRHPFATYGVVALLLLATAQALNLQYDGGILEGIVVISAPVWGIVYWGPSELLFALNDGRKIFAHSAISIAVGLAVCLLADYSLITGKKRDARQE